MLFIEPVIGDQDLELVQVGLFAQQRQSVQSDVAIDHVLHARLCLAYIMDAAGNTQRLLFSLRRLDQHAIADACAGHLKSISLDEYFSGGRRPCALLRHQRADAYVPEVLHYKEHQAAPLRGTSFDPTVDHSAGFSIADFAVQ